MGEGRMGNGRKGEEWRNIYSLIKKIIKIKIIIKGKNSNPELKQFIVNISLSVLLWD